MLYKCLVGINNQKYKDIKVDGVVEILEDRKLHIYFDCISEDSCQTLIEYLNNIAEEHHSLFLESSNFNYICWDCYISSCVMKTIDCEKKEEEVYFTINGEMIRISCHAWIDYPFDMLKQPRLFEHLILENGSIDISNMDEWNTLGNNGRYDYSIDIEGISLSIRRWIHHQQIYTESRESDVATMACSFQNNVKYALPELIKLLASLRDFFSFITGRFVQIGDIKGSIQLEDERSYHVVFHTDLTYYYPCVCDEETWHVNNVNIEHINTIGLNNLFRNWNAQYAKKPFPLSFFNRTSMKALSSYKYIVDAIIAFDSLTTPAQQKNISGEQNLRNLVYDEFKKQFQDLGYEKNDIRIGESSTTMRFRLEKFMQESGLHYKDFQGREYEDKDISKTLKDLRDAAAHGRSVRQDLVIKPHGYYCLSLYVENLLIELIKQQILGV